MGTADDDDDEPQPAPDDKPVHIRNAVGLQKLKLDKLMKNPDKPVIIPERQKDRRLPHVPDFVRNVMGSSAGAGSGEFHVYRHLRRKEYARQKCIQERGRIAALDEAYQQKLLENKQKAEEKTAKKRAKRLKLKEKLKKKKLENPKSDSTSKEPQPETESDSDADSTSGPEDLSAPNSDQPQCDDSKPQESTEAKSEL